MGVDNSLLLALFLLLIRRDVKYCLLLLKLEDDTEDLVVAVHSEDYGDYREVGELKVFLMISSS